MARSSSASQPTLFEFEADGKRPIIKLLAEPPRLSELEPVLTLIPVFEAIRGFLAANATGMTRDEAILDELTKLLHAKVYDEKQAANAKGALRFFALSSDSPEAVKARVAQLYAESIRQQLNGEGGAVKDLLLDEQSCYYAVQTLHHRRLVGAGRDVIGEAYETLIFPALRGGQGQFFTPKNVGECLASILAVQPGERVIDPACGTGGFLVEVAAQAGCQSGTKGKEPPILVGIDKDELLVRLASDSLALRGIDATIACANSLVNPTRLGHLASRLLVPCTYDVVITNPPFGSKIPVTGAELLGQYDLARRWTTRNGVWNQQDDLRDAVPPQTLFLELCWRLLKEGGRCGIVLPEGVLGNQSLGFIREWLLQRADILAVIDCPLETFMPSTSTKTVLLVFQRRAVPLRPPVFMAIAEVCGHDRRGKALLTADGRPADDFPLVTERWRAARREEGTR